MESHHNVSPFYLSIIFACWTDLGNWIPNLWVRIQYLDFTFAIILFCFFKTYGTHQANSGSADIRDWTQYFATCTGYDSFISLRDTQVVIPYFHCTSIFHPAVVSWRRCMPLLAFINASCYLISLLSVWWSAILSNNAWRLPSTSTFANRLMGMALYAVEALCWLLA